MQNLQTVIKPLSYYVTDLQSGSRPKGGVRGIETGIPSVGGEHLNSYGGFDFSSIRFVSPDFANGITKGKIKQNDILIVKDGATTGKVSFVDDSFPYNNATINEHIFILRTNEKIIPKFLFWYFWCRNGQTEILKNFQGSAQGGINRSFLDGVDVPDLPIEYQEKVIKKLDSYLSRCWLDQTRLKKARSLISKFRQSVLSAAVTGKLTEEWRGKKGIASERQEAKLKDLVDKHGIFDGPFGSHLKTADYTDHGVRVIRLENIGFLNFIESKKTYVSEQKYQELSRHAVGEGDIIFASFIAEGIRVVILPPLETKAIAKADCFCIRVNAKALNKEYLCYALSSSQISQQLALQIHGATRPRINTTQLKETLLPLPTVEEQNEIARRVKSIFDAADLTEKQIETAGKRTDKLTQSILAKAFRGEL